MRVGSRTKKAVGLVFYHLFQALAITIIGLITYWAVIIWPGAGPFPPSHRIMLFFVTAVIASVAWELLMEKLRNLLKKDGR